MPSTPSSPEPGGSRRRYAALAAVCVLIAAGVLAAILVTNNQDSSSGGTSATTVVPPYDTSKARVGQPAPDFALPSVGGNIVRLSQFRGTPVVLTFFASWCHPCEEELPALQQLQKEQGKALAVVAVNYRDIASDTRRFVRDLGVTYPALLESEAENVVAGRYGVHGIPITFFIDAAGRIATEPLYGEGSRSALQPGIDAIMG